MSDQAHAVLFVERGIDGVRFFPLNIGANVIGKSDTCDIVINNPFVSRRHALIVQQESQFYIEDLGSKNGTYLNGVRLGSGKRRLLPGDRVDLILDDVVLSFLDENSTLTFVPISEKSSTEILVVDVRSREVWVRNHRVEPSLSKKEFDILHLLYRKRGEVCSKQEIAVCGWPERRRGEVADQDIEQYIRRLRLKLEDDPSTPKLIITVHSFGYKLAE